jgi:hypothetical protein
MSIHRKYILWIIFAAMLLYFGGDWLLAALRSPMAQARERTKKLQEQIRLKKAELKTIRAEKEQLADWEAQSLPADPRLARSLYQAWLVELAEHVGLVKPNVDSNEPANHKDLYEQYTFTVRGQGTLEQVTQLLFEFYRAGHLHQIRNLDLTPTQQGKQFNISLIIEAVSLPQIKRRDELGDAKVQRLKSDQLADYQIIARRNVFGEGHDPDVLTGTRLTAVTSRNGRLEAWFSVAVRDETLQKAVGEKLDLDGLSATILEIEDGDVVLEIDGQRRLMTIGETLAEASALPPGLL